MEVIKSKWQLVSNSFKVDQDPLLINEQQAALEKAIKETVRENQIRVNANQPQIPIPTRGTTTSRPTTSRPSTWYRYEVKVRNTGAKTIRRLTWEYAQATNTPSREFSSNAKIRPGATKNLVVKSSRPPTGVVDASQIGKAKADEAPEQVIILRVEYEDRAVWTRTPQ